MLSELLSHIAALPALLTKQGCPNDESDLQSNQESSGMLFGLNLNGRSHVMVLDSHLSFLCVAGMRRLSFAKWHVRAVAVWI